ncbi:MAG: FitA-like ribbon-helix-helix domain-containing protein [Candidatus Cybelea sp.]
MGDILIRNVPDATVARLKARAKRDGRSLQAEFRRRRRPRRAARRPGTLIVNRFTV